MHDRSIAPHKHYIAFRYAEPLTENAIEAMKRDGVSRAVAMTLYPQYSCSTTGSSLNELHRKLKVLDPQNSIKWSVVDRWATNPKLVEVSKSSRLHKEKNKILLRKMQISFE
jgi:protoporphyrin/coproporphyrin ferrochelatase